MLKDDPWMRDRIAQALDAIRYADREGLETELDLLAFAEDVVARYAGADALSEFFSAALEATRSEVVAVFGPYDLQALASPAVRLVDVNGPAWVRINERCCDACECRDRDACECYDGCDCACHIDHAIMFGPYSDSGAARTAIEKVARIQQLAQQRDVTAIVTHHGPSRGDEVHEPPF